MKGHADMQKNKLPGRYASRNLLVLYWIRIDPDNPAWK